ncbi:MAG TPA: tetratricopeptide repeat protein [Acidisarcina sp.]
MPSVSRRLLLLSAALLLLCAGFTAPLCRAQASPSAGTPAPSGTPIQERQSPDVRPQPQPLQKPPALVDPAGPAVSLQTSEALFDIAVALNACGYDDELANSDPIRTHVRAQVDELLQGSDTGREARDRLCAYINQHRLVDAGRNLAQYVSLALYLTPPPDLSPSVDQTEMPPDSTQVLELLPLLKLFVQAINLHAVWLSNRQAYEDEVNQLHEPLTRMILGTNIYLKMPTSAYDGRRFLVVLEPMLAPGQTNARVYGADYVVVASPVNGTIHMREVRHTYLHYEIEPLLYSRTGAVDRLLPILKTVRDAPLDFTYKSDVLALVIECMIRAIEARTLETGIPVYTPPANAGRNDMARIDRERNAYQQKVAALRQRPVDESMVQGYVLTQYFYEALEHFERGPTSIKESVGEMVYGMDVDFEVRRARRIEFAAEGSSDVVRRTPRQLAGLDLAEIDLMKGDTAGAAQLAQRALDQHSGDPARADYILALSTLGKNDMEGAQHLFEEAIRLSRDPRTLAWSHIYRGRIFDVQDERDQALSEYRLALTVRDGQADTKQAAEKGIKAPFELPHHAEAGGAAASSPAATPPQ